MFVGIIEDKSPGYLMIYSYTRNEEIETTDLTIIDFQTNCPKVDGTRDSGVFPRISLLMKNR